MKSKNILILLMFVSSFIYAQDFKPAYQSNYSLDFNSFLGGVKYAYISLDDEEAQYIVDNPSSGNAYAISGLLSYLKAIGFEDVKWGTRANTPQNFPSICELVIVSASWGYENSTFTDIKLSFYSCKGDEFTFNAAKNIWVNGYTNISTSFHNTFMKMYGLEKTLKLTPFRRSKLTPLRRSKLTP